MIVSPGRRFVFVHIPKTGGTSMALALEARAMADDILIGDTPKARKRRGRLKQFETTGRLWKHSRLADIDGMVPGLPDFFVFTMVRNPWDRMVSLYHWLREQSFDHVSVTLAKDLAFANFLSDPKMAASFRADSAAAYVTDAGDVMRCDTFVRLEHLAEDLPAIERHLGIPLHPLPHQNQSMRPNGYRSEYTDRTAALVADYYADDIARFAYRF